MRILVASLVCATSLSAAADPPKTCPLPPTAPLAALRAQGDRLALEGAATPAADCLRRAMALPSRDAVAVAELQARRGSLLAEAGDTVAGRREILAAHVILVRSLGKDDVRAVRATEELAFVDFLDARYAESARGFESAEQGYRRRLPPNDLNIGRVLNRRAIVARERSEYASAESLATAALAIASARRDDSHADLEAQIHNTRGGLYYYQGDLRRAVAEFSRARELLERLYGERSIELTRVYNNLGFMYFELGALDEAERWLQRAVMLKTKLFGARNASVAGTITNLAMVAEQRRDIAGARRRYTEAIAIYEESLGHEHPGIAIPENALGGLEYHAGNHANALKHISRALALRERAYGADSTWVAESLNYQTPVLAALGRSREAREAALRSISILTPASEPETLWKSYAAYARVLAGERQLAAAAFYGKRAVNLIQALRSGLVTVEGSLQRSFVVQREPIYRETADWLVQLGRLPEARQVLDMLKEEEYLDFLRTRAATEDAGSTRAVYSTREAPLAAQLDQTATRLLAGDPRAQSRYLDLLRKTTTTLGSAPAVGETRSVSIRERLPLERGDTAVLQYLVLPERIELLVRTQAGDWRASSPMTATALNREVFALRAALAGRGAGVPASARRLHEALVRPVLGELERRRIRRLLLVEDSALRYLPFAALHDGQGYLIERYALSIVTPAALGAPSAPAAVMAPIAGFGVTQSAAGLPALPGVSRELELIIRQDAGDRDGVAPGRIALDAEFTAARLRAAMSGQYPTLHIASHFVFRPGALEDSYLLLGQGQRLPLDAFKTREYAMTRVGLLTLSACDTAVVEAEATGREFESFGALAQRQGAGAVLATLWPVSDLGAATFMARFYRLRSASADTALALQQAQIESLRRPGAERRPYYWAPFVLMTLPTSPAKR